MFSKILAFSEIMCVLRQLYHAVYTIHVHSKTPFPVVPTNRPLCSSTLSCCYIDRAKTSAGLSSASEPYPLGLLLFK